VVLLAGLGLERVWQGGAFLTEGTPFRRWLWVGLAVLLAVVGAQNAADYFDRQAGHVACWSEFSCREFAIGNRLHELGLDTHAYISAGSFSYPTIRFLGYPYLDSEPFQGLASIPSQYTGPKRVTYALLPIHDGSLELLKYYYPQGDARAYPSPYDFTVFTEYTVTQPQVRAARGLNAVYQDDSGRRRERQDGADGFRLQDPGQGLRGGVRARWQGSLRVPTWGRYRFRLQGADEFSLRLDGQAASPEGLELAQGLHTCEMTAGLAASVPTLTLEWQREPGTWQVVPGPALSPQPEVHGLLASYFPTAKIQGRPLLRRVDPLLALLGADFPCVAPFSARWEGFVTARVKGTYGFGVSSNEEAWVYVDEKLVVENLTPDGYQEGAIRLSAGRHAIRIDYQKSEGAYPQMVLYWTPPGKVKQKVPFVVLSPQ